MNGGAMNGGAMNGGAMNGGAMNGGAMNIESIQSIVQKVNTLKRLDAKFSVFGSSSHRYELIRISDAQHQRLLKQNWPEEYVAFLHLVGSGAGPYYGIHQPSFEDAEDVWLLDESVEEESVDSEEDIRQRMIAAGATRNTIIPICDYGCGERFMLAVAGPRTGSLWFDYGFGDNSIEPLTSSFLEFYESWLDHSLRQQEPTL
jgi:hypothetical protein